MLDKYKDKINRIIDFSGVFAASLVLLYATSYGADAVYRNAKVSCLEKKLKPSGYWINSYARPEDYETIYKFYKVISKVGIPVGSGEEPVTMVERIYRSIPKTYTAAYITRYAGGFLGFFEPVAVVLQDADENIEKACEECRIIAEKGM